MKCPHGQAEPDLYRMMIQRQSVGIALVDGSGRIIIANEAFRAIAGACHPDACFRMLSEGLMPPDGLIEALREALRDGRAKVMLSDPCSMSHMVVELRTMPTALGDRRVLTEWHRVCGEAWAEEALYESEQRFRTLQQNLPVGIYRAGEDGSMQTANPALLTMTGYGSFNELNEVALDRVWVDPRSREELIRRLSAEGAVLQYVAALRRRDGSEFIGSFDARGTFDERGRLRYFDTIVQDITEQVQTRRELERLARIDALTGLENRQSLMAGLESELARALRYDHPLSLMILDLDHFKDVNDTHGHLVGDRVLATAAVVIKDTARVTDIVGRYGGEEFCVVLPETDNVGACLVAGRIRERVEEIRVELPHGSGLGITCSIGVAQASSPDADALIALADACLYKAKRAGRNRVVAAAPART